MSGPFIGADPNAKKAIVETTGDATHPGQINILGKGSPKITLRGNGKDGTPANQPQIAKFLVDHAVVSVEGEIYAENSKGQTTVHLNGETGAIAAGGNGASGRLHLFASATLYPPAQAFVEASTLSLDGQTGSIRARNSGKETLDLDGPKADLWLGGRGVSGDILIFPPDATDNHDTNQASLWIGGANGGISFRDTSGKSRIFIEGQTGQALVGGAGANGLLQLRDAAQTPRINLYGQNGKIEAGALSLAGDIDAANIQLRGDLILQNADCAEEFDIAADAAEVEPGTVMVVDEDGKLRPSEAAFDRRVAGVISGAGDYKPGIVLDRQYSIGRRLPIALVGKVFCKVDAAHGAIQVGDLLTTSPTPGHAMKAGDPLKAFGAVLGKALRPLAAGQGLIPILVALQ